MTESDDRKEWHWLRDMHEAIVNIETHPRFIEGKEAFDDDQYYRVWVLYHMERIGECVARLRKDLPSLKRFISF